MSKDTVLKCIQNAARVQMGWASSDEQWIEILSPYVPDPRLLTAYVLFPCPAHHCDHRVSIKCFYMNLKYALMKLWLGKCSRCNTVLYGYDFVSWLYQVESIARERTAHGSIG